MASDIQKLQKDKAMKWMSDNIKQYPTYLDLAQHCSWQCQIFEYHNGDRMVPKWLFTLADVVLTPEEEAK